MLGFSHSFLTDNSLGPEGPSKMTQSRVANSDFRLVKLNYSYLVPCYFIVSSNEFSIKGEFT